MKYGCIGEKLGHSFSAVIHKSIADYDYILREIPRDEIDSFMKKRDFIAVNVTIPYKEAVIPYLDHIDENAAKIGAVNTVVNKDGKLYGYNTDFAGLRKLIQKSGFDYTNKKVLICGSGGTSRTAKAAALSLGASSVICLSRAEKPQCETYANAYKTHSDADYIINTTPCGMWPDTDSVSIDILKFPSLKGVTDVVYNPLRSELVRRAHAAGIPAHGGLYMLVAQAVAASEIFTGTNYAKEVTDRVFKEIYTGKENIVLTGMAGAGKSTIGKLLAEATGKSYIDTDEMIESKTGKTPAGIINEYGEPHFRAIEKAVVKEAAARTSSVISTGGGAVLDPDNIHELRMNGRIIFLRRDIAEIRTGPERPITPNAERLETIYKERYPLYMERCDGVFDVSGTPEQCVKKILEMINVENTCD